MSRRALPTSDTLSNGGERAAALAASPESEIRLSRVRFPRQDSAPINWIRWFNTRTTSQHKLAHPGIHLTRRHETSDNSITLSPNRRSAPVVRLKNKPEFTTISTHQEERALSLLKHSSEAFPAGTTSKPVRYFLLAGPIPSLLSRTSLTKTKARPRWVCSNLVHGSCHCCGRRPSEGRSFSAR